ncbi:MAG: molybdenum cofactor biosynthesis protein MoaE [Desulfobacterales bacterium]|nr:molybdenum cofactor biosynthesis protein MoaE [Desulfobacterales bacterium]
MHITHEPISVEAFLKEKPDASCGASVHFIGTVRNHQDGRAVKRLYYECYESMADKQIAAIMDRVTRTYGVDQIRVLHRVGWLEVGDVAIIIKTSSAHRQEAFTACRTVVEEIKKKVPIWKKEVYGDGTSEWILCSHSAEVTS